MIELFWPLLVAPLLLVAVMVTVSQVVAWIAAFASVARQSLWG